MRSVIAVSAGLSDESTTKVLAERILTEVAKIDGDINVELITLRDLAHDITDATLTRFASKPLQSVYDKLTKADGIVAVTPIYKASYNGLFKSFFDAIEEDVLTGKPVMVAATGGTARHSLAIDYALRPLFAQMHAFVAPTGIFASPHDWGTDGSSALSKRIERAAGELVSMMTSGGTGRVFSDEIDLNSETMLSIAMPDLKTDKPLR